MRNWNYYNYNHCWIVLDCFYSTYEELKPGFWESHHIFKISFYSTYEELKRVRFICGEQGSGSFYSTYEELKLSF